MQGKVEEVGGALWHSLCSMRIVSVPSSHAKSVRPSLPSVNGDVWLGTVSHPLSNAAYQRIPPGITSAVSSKLSRSDFVQCLFIGN